jgi:nucleoside-diphosphate-sugar epimerase
MRLLILGGTVFLGRAVARHARDAGHQVTCLARGETGKPVDGVRFVAADRDSPDGLSAVAGESFDAVVDVTQRPSHARRAVEELAGRVGHWSYVSTCSVYADQATPGQPAATAPVVAPAPPEVDDPEADPQRYYGRCKVSCERMVLDGAGADRSFICRAGLIVGPEDRSGRFTYWVDRMARGGRVLAPGAPDEPVQLVDVRDLAGWLVDAGERSLAGVFDGIGAPMPRREFLAGVAAGVGVEPSLTWVDQDFLRASDVRPWAGERALPLWLPLPEYAGFMSRDVAGSQAAGLTIRPLEDTSAATLAWLSTPDAVRPGGLAAEDEAAVLRGWDGRAAA